MVGRRDPGHRGQGGRRPPWLIFIFRICTGCPSSSRSLCQPCNREPLSSTLPCNEPEYVDAARQCRVNERRTRCHEHELVSTLLKVATSFIECDLDEVDPWSADRCPRTWSSHARTPAPLSHMYPSLTLCSYLYEQCLMSLQRLPPGALELPRGLRRRRAGRSAASQRLMSGFCTPWPTTTILNGQTHLQVRSSQETPPFSSHHHVLMLLLTPVVVLGGPFMWPT